MKNQGLFWHVHHDTLFEYCYDAKERIDYIKLRKPSDEEALRLKLMRPVTLKGAPKWLAKLISEANRQCLNDPKKLETNTRALHRFWRAMGRLHKKQCHPQCPWQSSLSVIEGDILNHTNSDCIFTLKPVRKTRN